MEHVGVVGEKVEYGHDQNALYICMKKRVQIILQVAWESDPMNIIAIH